MPFPDPRFFRMTGALRADRAAEISGATLTRRGDAEIRDVAEVQKGGAGALVFAEKLKAQPASAAAVILPIGATGELEDEACTVLEAASPKLAFAKIAGHLFESYAETSYEGEPAELGEGVHIDPSAVIASGTTIGAGTIIGPQSYIGPGVHIGAGSWIGAQVSITHAELGERCRISAGVKIGECGFGYTAGSAGPFPIPQLGAVRIGDGVELGALTTVDRGTLSDTVIGNLTKIDNLCQIAHNCRIGRGVLIASQTGISGSCCIGNYVMMGGQVGMADHLNIGNGAVIAAKSGLMRDVEPGAKVGGTPAKPMRQWMKEIAALGRLASGK
jgi:UDP-3-O-[3-hydroxymyristoyl] glucosamine N-acyltransferase